MTNDSPKNTACLDSFFAVFAAVHGAASRARCWWASPSMRYSSFRKTISIMMVCGHVQPHHRRPNAVVKIMMPAKNVSIATAKMMPSSGQKIWPRMANRRSTMLNIRSGLPLIRMNGPANIAPMSAQLIQVRQRYHFPAGCLA